MQFLSRQTMLFMRGTVRHITTRVNEAATRYRISWLPTLQTSARILALLPSAYSDLERCCIGPHAPMRRVRTHGWIFMAPMTTTAVPLPCKASIRVTRCSGGPSNFARMVPGVQCDRADFKRSCCWISFRRSNAGSSFQRDPRNSAQLQSRRCRRAGHNPRPMSETGAVLWLHGWTQNTANSNEEKNAAWLRRSPCGRHHRAFAQHFALQVPRQAEAARTWERLLWHQDCTGRQRLRTER